MMNRLVRCLIDTDEKGMRLFSRTTKFFSLIAFFSVMIFSTAFAQTCNMTGYWTDDPYDDSGDTCWSGDIKQTGSVLIGKYEHNLDIHLRGSISSSSFEIEVYYKDEPAAVCIGKGTLEANCVAATGIWTTHFSNQPIKFNMLGSGNIRISDPPRDRVFAISREPRMPDLRAIAIVTPKNILKNKKNAFTYDWDLSLRYVLADNRVLYDKLPFVETDVPNYRADFSSLGMRGGDMTLHVQYGGNLDDSATYRVNGTNPGKTFVDDALVNPILRHIACHESGYRQFNADYHGGQGLPLLGGTPGGVGIMQVNNPTPSDEAVWNWRQNIAEGLSIFSLKQSEARNLPNTERQRLNTERAALSLPACPTGIPTALSSEQLDRETIRRYNCGREYRWEPRNAPNCAGQWRISPTLLPPCDEQRDKDYVDKVLSCNIP